jgi:hypothetical protein
MVQGFGFSMKIRGFTPTLLASPPARHLSPHLHISPPSSDRAGGRISATNGGRISFSDPAARRDPGDPALLLAAAGGQQRPAAGSDASAFWLSPQQQHDDKMLVQQQELPSPAPNLPRSPWKVSA